MSDLKMGYPQEGAGYRHEPGWFKKMRAEGGEVDESVGPSAIANRLKIEGAEHRADGGSIVDSWKSPTKPASDDGSNLGSQATGMYGLAKSIKSGS